MPTRDRTTLTHPRGGGQRPGLHRAAGDAKLVDEFELAPELRAGDLAAQEPLVLVDRTGEFLHRLIDELHTEAARAERRAAER